MNFFRLLASSVSFVTSTTVGMLVAMTPATANQVDAAQARQQEYDAIADKRKVIEELKQQSEKACAERFAVEDCLQKARRQWREQDSSLRTRELQLNQEAREEKTAQRLRAIEQKKQEKREPPIMSVISRQSEAPTSQRKTQTEKPTKTKQRIEHRQQDVIERQRAQSLNREYATQKLQSKQKTAQVHREKKRGEIANRTGAPLPIPVEIPAASSAE